VVDKPLQPFVYNGKGISIETHVINDAPLSPQVDEDSYYLEDEI